jgi:electron transfer DM13
MREQLTPIQPSSLPPAIRALVGLAMVMLLAAGVVVLGRLANSDGVAMALTGGWFALALLAGVALSQRRRELRLPLAAGWLAAAAATALLLGLPMLSDRRVDEQVVIGAPAGRATGAGSPTTAEAPALTGNLELARGRFVDLAHPGSGNAALVRLADGGRRLTLTGFATDRGPDLRVYLTTRDPADGGGIGDFVDLGALKGNRGNQQYTVPDDLDSDRYSTVVIWCRAFAVGFTSAALRP